jgi:hypothetical protein
MSLSSVSVITNALGLEDNMLTRRFVQVYGALVLPAWQGSAAGVDGRSTVSSAPLRPDHRRLPVSTVAARGGRECQIPAPLLRCAR